MEIRPFVEQLTTFLAPRETTQQGVRGVLNRYPVPAAAGVLLLAVVCLWFAFGRGDPSRSPAGQKDWYTTDGGATYFADSGRIPPFDKGGRQAVGARVYTCDGGKTRFVAYLFRYTPQGKERLEKQRDRRRLGPPVGMEVKRPGDGGQWAPVAGAAPAGAGDDAASVMTVKCPDGGEPYVVNPP